MTLHVGCDRELPVTQVLQIDQVRRAQANLTMTRVTLVEVGQPVSAVINDGKQGPCLWWAAVGRSMVFHTVVVTTFQKSGKQGNREKSSLSVAF